MNVGESNRLKEFRQLRKEIRGSKEHLIVGIDVAKNKHHAFFGVSAQFIFPVESQGTYPVKRVGLSGV
jgi:hypothetical protein